MTPDEHVAHAAAVKLMEDKDYFVTIYNTCLQHCLGSLQSELYKDSSGAIGHRCVGGTRGMSFAVREANELAKLAMEPIINYGRTEK